MLKLSVTLDQTFYITFHAGNSIVKSVSMKISKIFNIAMFIEMQWVYYTWTTFKCKSVKMWVKKTLSCVQYSTESLPSILATQCTHTLIGSCASSSSESCWIHLCTSHWTGAWKVDFILLAFKLLYVLLSQASRFPPQLLERNGLRSVLASVHSSTINKSGNSFVTKVVFRPHNDPLNSVKSVQKKKKPVVHVAY